MVTSWRLVLVKCMDDDSLKTFDLWARDSTRYHITPFGDGKTIMLGGGTKGEWKEIQKMFPTIKVIPDMIV